MIFIYGDETEFESSIDGKFEKFIGTGVLYTRQKIEEHLIQEAIENLKNDSDIENPQTKKYDQATLNNGYFHASTDSKNAHSFFCRAINQGLQGKLHYTYIQERKSKNKTIEQEISESLGLSLLDIFSKNESTKIEIEGRSKFNRFHFEKLVKKLYENIFRVNFEKPQLQFYFPKYNVEIVNKRSPGIQVLDFILWATNRNFKNPKEESWFQRLNCSFSAHFAGLEEYSGTVRINGYHDQNAVISYPYYDLYKSSVDDFSDFYGLYRLIKDRVAYYLTSDLPDEIEHFKEYYVMLNQFYSKTIKSLELLEKIIDLNLQIYLMLFDTLPLYNQSTQLEEMKMLLCSKKFAALLLRKDLINSMRMRSEIINFYLRKNE